MIPREALEDDWRPVAIRRHPNVVLPVILLCTALILVFVPHLSVYRLPLVGGLVALAVIITVVSVRRSMAIARQEREIALFSNRLTVVAPVRKIPPIKRKRALANRLPTKSTPRQIEHGQIIAGSTVTVPMVINAKPSSSSDCEALARLGEKLIKTPGVSSVQLLLNPEDDFTAVYLQFIDVSDDRVDAILQSLPELHPMKDQVVEMLAQSVEKHPIRVDWDILQVPSPTDNELWVSALQYQPVNSLLGEATRAMTVLHVITGLPTYLLLTHLLDDPQWRVVVLFSGEAPDEVTFDYTRSVIQAGVKGIVLNPLCGAPDIVMSCLDPARKCA